MTIPHFKDPYDWETFTSLFDARWHCKKALLNRVKDDLYPGYNWDQLQPQTLETIHNITQTLLYDVEYTFHQSHPEYKREYSVLGDK